MATIRLKVARIGNSRGVRLPAASLRRYRIGDTVLMEELSEGILLRPTGTAVKKLSWGRRRRARWPRARSLERVGRDGGRRTR